MQEADADLKLMVDAAQEAGRIATRHFHAGHEVWEKGEGQGPVTEADLEVDAMLHQVLTTARPDYGWLSEESRDSAERLQRRHTCIIDPIDGTRSFTEGHHTWAHSLAVARDGQITAGVVFLPLREKLYTATLGGGAWLNGARLTASIRKDADDADILAARPTFEARHWPGGVPHVHRHFRSSLAYRLCLVGEGRFDGMLMLRRTWEWDIAAGTLIATEAGARATDRAGADIRFNTATRQSPGILCAAAGVHADFVARLNAA